MRPNLLQIRLSLSLLLNRLRRWRKKKFTDAFKALYALCRHIKCTPHIIHEVSTVECLHLVDAEKELDINAIKKEKKRKIEKDVERMKHKDPLRCYVYFSTKYIST